MTEGRALREVLEISLEFGIFQTTRTSDEKTSGSKFRLGNGQLFLYVELLMPECHSQRIWLKIYHHQTVHVNLSKSLLTCGTHSALRAETPVIES